MNRFKNYGLWLAIAGLVGMVLTDAHVGITPDKYDGYVNAVMTILVLAGIINNPTSGSGFKDEK